MPTEYQLFVKNNIKKFNHLPKQTDRMRAVAQLYRQQKGVSQSKTAVSAVHSKPSPMHSMASKNHGGGLLDHESLLAGLQEPIRAIASLADLV